jgi:hypothetical protein
MLRWLSVLLQMFGVSSAGSTLPATFPATAELTLRSLELRVDLPRVWKVTQDSDEESDSAQIKVDDASTLIVIERKKALLKAEALKKHVDAAIDRHRESLLKNGRKVLREEKVAVAGSPGKLLEVELVVSGHTMRMMFVYFLLGNREGSVTFVGQRDFYSDARPHVLRMLDSMKPSAAEGQKIP